MTPLRSAMIWLGGFALIAATAVDTFAVIGRQIGWPLRGSIELVQAAVLVAGCIALIAATLADRHARVQLILDRLGPSLRRHCERVCELMTAVFLLCVLAGSAWLAVDLWASNELSEILGVPWRWMRLFANLSLVAALLIVLRHAVAGRRA
jgi:TRAP-type transport system small permease protein